MVEKYNVATGKNSMEIRGVRSNDVTTESSARSPKDAAAKGSARVSVLEPAPKVPLLLRLFRSGFIAVVIAPKNGF